jgi:hypothetical protein
MDLRALLERADGDELRRALNKTLEALVAVDLMHPVETWRVRVFRLIALLPVGTAAWVLSWIGEPGHDVVFSVIALALNAGTAVHVIMGAERRWHTWCTTRRNVRDAALRLKAALQENDDASGSRQV